MPYKNIADKRANDSARKKTLAWRVYIRKYRAANKDRISEVNSAYQRRYRKENKELLRTYYKTRYRTDLKYRLKSGLRARLRDAVKNNYRGGSAVKLLGCSIEQFVEFISTKFLIGMTWENWGEWHLDHKRPLCSFNLACPKDIARACHFSNFQPLWARDNIKKGGSLDVCP